MASACEAAIVAIGVSHGCCRRPSLVGGTLRPTTAAKALPQSSSSFISLVPTAPLLNRAAAPSAAAAAAAVGGAAGGRHAVRGGKRKGGASKRSPSQQVRAQEGGAEEAVGVEVAGDESEAVKELLEAAAALGVSGEVAVAPVGETPVAAAASTGIEVDAVAEADLKENGFRSTRRTKLICTIGPASCSFEQLEALASGGMNVARLNMCHGTHEWHRGVIQSVRRLNAEKGYSVAVMMDTEGSEIHMGDLGGLSSCKAEDGEEWTFTVRNYPAGALPPQTIQVNYDGFVDDVQEGDEINVDGGMVRFEVLSKIGPDVRVRVIDPGLLLPRAGITFFRRGRLVRARNAMLPTVSSKDWIDIDFGIAEGVDFIAISFVKSPEVLTHLRSYINARSPNRYIGLIAKIESSDSLPRLPDIVRASDGAMVARGDLGAQIPLELVPTAQEDVVRVCRQLNKPVIVASQLLESMIEFPTPTRAEVADVSEAVRQKADALMLSGESAMGQYPDKALSVARSVAARTEQWTRDAATSAAAAAARSGGSSSGVLHGAAVGDLPLLQLSQQLPDRISEQLCSSAALMATNLQADAIFVYTRRGYMASLLSRCRPDCPIFAFTASQDVRQKLNLYWGLIPFRLDFSDDMEDNLRRTFYLLKARGMMKSGDVVISVSDILSHGERQSVEVRRVPE